MKQGNRVTACLLVLLLALPLSACSSTWPFNTRPHTYAIAIEDFDNDGNRDVYLANGENEGLVKDILWVNNGHGGFDRYIEQNLELETDYVAVGDLDGDMIQDAVTDSFVALNDGQGAFTYSPVNFGNDKISAYTTYPVLGDLDGDGDRDLVLGGCCGGVSLWSANHKELMLTSTFVLFNDGMGSFTDSGQMLGNFGVSGAALGDLDGDGDLDLYTATSSAVMDTNGTMDWHEPDMIWWNDGEGNFTDSGQRLGSEESYAVALGDLDGDGDLDAFTGTSTGCTLWWNDGSGLFTPGERVLGSGNIKTVALADIELDGDLDAYASGRGFGELWLNQNGSFQQGGRVNYSEWAASTIGDIDGDKQVEIVAALLGEWVKVWENSGTGKFHEVWE